MNPEMRKAPEQSGAFALKPSESNILAITHLFPIFYRW
jgi:hypothetical protein